MTTGTTDDPTAAPGAPRWLGPATWGLAGLLHVLVLAAVGPWAYTSMTFDPAQEAERTEAVRQAEAQRLAHEQDRRERTRLPERDAEQLARDAARERLPQLRESVRDLEQQRQALQELWNRRLEELEQRREQDLAAARMARLDEATRWLAHRLDEVTDRRTEDQATNRELEQLVRELRERVAATVADPSDYTADAAAIAEAARRVHELTDRVRQTDRADPTRRHKARQLGEQAAVLEQEAEALAAGVDTAQAADGLAEARQTLEAASMTDASDEATEAASDDPNAAAALYERARQAEEQVARAFDGIKAAEDAMASGRSLAQAAADASAARVPGRPDLAAALADPAVGTVGDLGRLRAALDHAAREAADMARRSQNLARQATGAGTTAGQASTPQSAVAARTNAAARLAARNAARGEKGRVINMTAFTTTSAGAAGTGAQGATFGFVAAGEQVGLHDTNNAVLAPTDPDLLGPIIRLNPDAFSRKTLPGRMITDQSDRAGWLYLDTWYVIGPWENHGDLGNLRPHPPEAVIDLDATYHDGKFADQPDHPLHVLAWEFYQSDQLRNQPPHVHANSTYYAYTELYSDRDREVLFTISTDDAAKVWLNDQLVWEDVGGSPWQVGEGFRRVALARGYNRLLVRIANGPVYCVWSVVFCPVEVAAR